MQLTKQQIETGRRLTAVLELETTVEKVSEGPAMTRDDVLAVGAVAAFDGYDGDRQLIWWCLAQWIKHKLEDIKHGDTM